MKVLFCSHEPEMSGAQRCLTLLLENLNRDEVEPVVIFPAEGRASRWCEERGIAYEIVPVIWWVSTEDDLDRQTRRFATDLRARVQRYVDLVEKHRIEVVVTNTSVIIEPAIAAALANVPHVWHVLEVVEQDPDLHSIFGDKQYRELVCSLSDKVVGVSSIVTQALSNCASDDKLAIIHTGISEPSGSADLRAKRAELQLADDAVVVTYIGMLNRRKGVATLGRAIKQIAESQPHVRFLFAGPDLGAEAEVRSTLETFVAKGQVQILGHRKDALEILAASDIFVMPSLVDPLPVAMMEAMSLSKAAIGTRSGGCVDLLANGECGLLVEAGNENELAAALLKYINDPVMRREAGAAAKRRIQAEFSVMQYVRRFTGLLEDIKKTPRRGGEREVTANLLLSLEKANPPSLMKELMARSEDQLRKAFRQLRKRVAR